MFEQLKKQFDQKSVQEVEKYADESKSKSLSGRMDFIKVLYYLRHTGRYKENRLFKNSTFEQYIGMRHQLRPATFENEAWAFFKFPKESENYGPGLVNKVRRTCGTEKVTEVMAKIEAIPGKTLDMQKINNVVHKFERPEVKKLKADKKARPTIKSIQSALDKAHGTIQQQEIELRAAYERIEKLKATAKEYKDKYENLLKVAGPVAAMVTKTVEQRANA